MNQEKILTLIDSPYITEKVSKLASEKNQVVFKVNINANKLERFSKPESIVRISNRLEVFFYDSKEKIKSFLSAKNAEINDEGKHNIKQKIRITQRKYN